MNAQSQKDIDRASDLVDALNEKIILVNPESALSDSQILEIESLFLQRITETKRIKKSNSSNSETEIKELRTEISRKLNYDILSKTQRKAKFSGDSID